MHIEPDVWRLSEELLGVMRAARSALTVLVLAGLMALGPFVLSLAANAGCGYLPIVFDLTTEDASCDQVPCTIAVTVLSDGALSDIEGELDDGSTIVLFLELR